MRIFEDNITLINPNVDASDKEMHMRNGFKTSAKNLVTFIKNNN